MLLIPRKQLWTRQPQQAVQVDWSNPITSIIRTAVVAEGSGFRAITRKGEKYYSFGAAAINRVGPAVKFPGSSYLDIVNAELPTSGTSGIFVVGRPTTINTESWASLGTYSSMLCQQYGSWRYDRDASGAMVTGSSVINNKALVLVGVQNGSSASIGQDIGPFSSAAYGTVSTQTILRLGADGDGRKLFTGELNILFVIGGYDLQTLSKLKENPWQIFRAPDSRIFAPTGAGAAVGAVLAGNAQAQATATGNLTLKADLDAVALSVATASGNLTTFIPLTGAAVAIGSASGALTSGIKLSAAATASALASGSLVAQIKLNGAALAQAAASAGLTSAILLAGSGQAQATASGTLAAALGSMSGNAQAQASAVATLTTSIKLSGAAAAQAGVSGILTTNISLTAAALAQAIATGMLAVPILLAGAARGVATATGNLTAPDSATAVYFRLASSVQRLTKAACTAQRLTTIKHEVQHV